jgi:hypothetical protein
MGPSISGLFRRGAGRSEVCASTLALAAVDHRHLDLVRQHFEVTGQPIEHRALGLVGRKVADSGTLRGVPSQLFDLCLIVFHRSGGFRPGDESHSLMCQAVSICRIFYVSAARSGPPDKFAS